MNRAVRSILVSVLFATGAGALLLASQKMPLWRMRMESPQYQGKEALRVDVYPGAMRGDLNEIHTLNRYIGVSVPLDLPQFRWLPPALWTAAGIGLLAALLPLGPRRRSQALVAMAVAVTLIAAAVLAQAQMYRIGHERNPHAPLRGVKNFTPPIIGTVKIENFTVHARLGAGAWVIGTAILLYIGGAMGRPRHCVCGHGREDEAAAKPKEATLV